PPHLVLVTAYGREEVFHQAEDAGIRDVLVKPLNASVLFDAAMRTLHGGGGDEIRSAAAAPSALLETLDTIAGARILLVEDNALNQEVALEILRQAHFAVDLAENGRVALARLQDRDYDLVLMDMQMPLMDGVEATRELRRETRFAQLPVVAMTANALTADRERCLAAGMNDFLTKPIEPELLWQALLKWIPRRHELVTMPTVTVAVPPAPTFDLGIPEIDCGPALRRMLGRSELYLSTLRKFCPNQENTMEAVRAALESDDWRTAERLAHSLKGVAGSIGAGELTLAAAALEKALAERRPRVGIDEQIDTLDIQLAELIAALRSKLPPPPVAAIADAATSRAAAGELERLLEDSDPEVMSWLESHSDALRGTLAAARVVEIEAAVRAFDLDDALRLLREANTLKENT
ncbi:MAG: response regulator, partial [Rhodocyclaceae bacterium]